MSFVVIDYRNILETGTVTVTTENSSFPQYRLYDRDIGKLFKGNSTPANFYITIDQGAVTSCEVDRLIIPAGHNLDGLTIKLQYSTDNFAADNHDALDWVQSGSGAINKTFTAQTKQYWRLNIAAPASAPQLAEMYLTKDYTFQENFAYAGSKEDWKRNLVRYETRSKRVRKVKLGEKQRLYAWSLPAIDAAQKTDFESWETHTEGLKNIYIIDHDGDLFFMEMLNDLSFDYISSVLSSTRLDLLEVL